MGFSRQNYWSELDTTERLKCVCVRAHTYTHTCKENRIIQRLQNNSFNIDPDRTSAEEMKLLAARMGLVNGKPDLVHPWSKML